MKNKKNFEWNKITPLSKYLAMVLFIALPFIGFVLGMKYQKTIDSSLKMVDSKQIDAVNTSTTPTPLMTNWKTYISKKHGFEVQYPSSWILNGEEYTISAIGGLGLTSDVILENVMNKNNCGPGYCYPSLHFFAPLTNGNNVKTPKEWVKNFFATNKLVSASEALNKLIFEETIVGGAPAIKVLFSPTSEYLFIFKNSNIYIIAVEIVNTSNEATSYPLFKQVLSTFKFVQ